MSRTDASGSRGVVFALCLGCALLLLPQPSGATAACKDDRSFARVEIFIHYERTDRKYLIKSVDVRPEEVKIFMEGTPNRVCWVITNLMTGLSLEISGKARPGNPKPFGGKPIVAKDGEAASPVPGEPGRWLYQLMIRGGPDDYVKDPVVVIDPGSGGTVSPGGSGGD